MPNTTIGVYRCLFRHEMQKTLIHGGIRCLYDDLRRKAEALRMTAKGRKGIQTVIVTTYGIRPGQYEEGVQGVVTIDALVAGV